ncbi:phage holin family protein [Trueperella bialowiezensis]|uniref:Protein of uncharacterized function (DUF1469) n=1 Tax=Trueperella bialowiezensis TaxID=312285 RepID=A0A448PF79_9ACTO|nr:phage holin family protein [Trueperella bialowiezensis]VEI13583.1 Protein of uncharacterised function (DUF1469) [Trueperella bialowiezensis]
MTDKSTPSGASHGRAAPSDHTPEGPTSLSGKGPVAPRSGQSIGELIAKVTAQFSALMRDEVQYAKLQAAEKVKKLGVGGALFAVAGVLALYLLPMLLMAAAFGLANVMPLWAAFLVVSGILLVVIGILVAVGANRMKKAREHEVDPIGGFQKNVDAVKKGLNQ